MGIVHGWDRNRGLGLALLVSALYVVGWLVGGVSQLNDGTGMDGTAYSAMIQHFPDLRDVTSRYYAGRLLPVTIVSSGLLLTGHDLPLGSMAPIVAGYRLLNLAALVGSCFLWARIARDLTFRAFLLGAAALFLNFPAAVMFRFQPVMVDATTMLLSLAALAAYLENRRGLLAALILPFAFTWDVGAIGCVALLAFPPDRKAISDPPPALLRLAVIASLAAASATFWLPESRMVNATAIPSMLLVGWAGLQLAGARFEALRWPRPGALALGLSLYAATAAFKASFALQVVHGYDGTPLDRLFKFIAFPPVLEFYLPFIAAMTFWGPLVALLLLRWRAVAHEANAIGGGFTIVTATALPLVLVTEPRFISAAWPFLVLASLRGLDVSRRLLAVFVALSFAWSKIWFPINHWTWTGAPYDRWHLWPKQSFFLNFGLWMNFYVYLASFAFALVTILLLNRLAGPGATIRPPQAQGGIEVGKCR